MSTLLAEAVAELGLESGQTYTTVVGDREIEIRVRDTPSSLEQREQSLRLAESVMLNVFLEVPPSPKAILVEVTSGKWPDIDPVIIEEWDRTEE